MRVDFLVSEVTSVQPIDLFTFNELADVMNMGWRPAPAPVSARDAEEARELMDGYERFNLPGLPESTATPTLPHPLLGITAEPTIIKSPIETLIDEMRGWRKHEIAGGWVLDILPRSEPKGWHERAGVIQKKDFVDFADIDHARFFVGYFGGVPSVEPYFDKEPVAWKERTCVPRWLVEERERTARTVGNFLTENHDDGGQILQCPDGHTLSGKPQTI